MSKMNRDEFKKLYPDASTLEKPYSKIVSVHSEKNYLTITEEIDLTHPDCPIVVIKESKK